MLTPSHVGGSVTAHPKRWTGAGAGWVSLKLMSSEIANPVAPTVSG